LVRGVRDSKFQGHYVFYSGGGPRSGGVFPHSPTLRFSSLLPLVPNPQSVYSIAQPHSSPLFLLFLMRLLTFPHPHIPPAAPLSLLPSCLPASFFISCLSPCMSPFSVPHIPTSFSYFRLLLPLTLSFYYTRFLHFRFPFFSAFISSTSLSSKYTLSSALDTILPRFSLQSFTLHFLPHCPHPI